MGQGNKKKYGRAKGYSPSSIGSKLGSSLGGHLSKAGKLGGSASKGFNFSFKNFFNKFKPGYANTMGQVTGNLNQLNKPSAWKVKQFADKNIDITKMNKSFKVDIDTDRAIQGIKNEKIKNWLNKYTPKSVKNLKISHQMYSPTKIKPNDPRYNPTGTGSIQLDPDTEKYLEWMAKTNPTGMTISDAKKLYKKQIDEGISLKDAMRFNKAETGSFYALIDDTQKKEEEKALNTKYENDKAIYNSTNNMTTKTQTDKEWLTQAYKDTFGRDASYGTTGGADYWVDKLKNDPTGHSRTDVLKMLQGSDEGKKFAASKTTANPGGTVMPGGVNPKFSLSSQAGPGTWASHFAPGGVYENQDGATAIKNIASDIGFGTKTKDGTVTTPGYFNTGVTDQTGADKTGTTIPPAVSDGWWTKFADADAFKKFLQPDAAADTKSDGMGDFMKFMMLMSVMGGGRGMGGGGYGGSQFGYGGLNPGGVQAAYDPMANLKGMGTWFKDNFGTKTTTPATTATVNAT